jgi:membrane associated rhomboid family serine protease
VATSAWPAGYRLSVLPLYDENPVSRRPVVTWLIVAACIAAFLFWQPTPFTDTVEDTQFTLEWAAIPCEVLQARPLSVDEVVATYQLGDDEACGVGSPEPPFDADKLVFGSVLVATFLHAGLLHLLGNLLFLWVFGNNVEDRLGHLLFALFYLTGGVVASLAHVVVNASSTVPLVGASGAIAAVMGAYLVWFPHARVRTLVFIVVMDLRAVWVLGIWFLFQFFTDPNDGVAWMAHVGGFLFGMVVALVVRAAGGGPPEPVPPGHGYYGGWRPPRRPDGRY